MSWMTARRAIFGGGKKRPSIDLALKASAQRIVNGYNLFAAPTTMGAAPTMTKGTTYGNTLIPSQSNNVEAPMILATDTSKVRSTGPVKLVNAGFLPSGVFGNWITVADGGPTYRDGGSGWGYGLRTVSRYVEACVNFSSAANSPWRIFLRVNGQWAKASDYVMFTAPADDQPYPILFDFGSTSAQPREIEFFLPYNGNLFGFNVVTGSAVTPMAAPAVKLSYWSDSYGAGGYAGQSNLKHTLWQVFSERLGCSDPVPECLGGQGYVAQVNGRTIGNRIADDAGKITGLDGTFGHFSINDFASAQATTIAATVAGLTNLQAQIPTSCWIGWFVGFPADNANNPSRYAAYKAALEAAADARTIIVDVPAVKLISTTGTLPNDAAHDSPDGTHPGVNEIDYAAPWMADQFISKLTATAGL